MPSRGPDLENKVYVLIINDVSCPPGALIWKIKYLVSCIQLYSGTVTRVSRFTRAHR